MKYFLNDLLKFSAFFIISTLVLSVGTTVLAKNIISFEIPDDKTSLIVGDSRPESAINDDILSNAFNFSQSGTAYFYSYLKIRAMLENNPHIDTLVLGYAYDDISKSRDEWFNGAEMIKFKMPKYLLLFNYRDFISLFQSNPYEVSKNIHRTVIYNSSAVLKYIITGQGIDHLGGFQYLERDKLQEAKNRYSPGKDEENLEYSKYQEEYLLKIYNLARSKNIDLILLNTPIHALKQEAEEKYKDYYYSFAEHQLPETVIVNHTNMDIPEYGFGDLEHLNYKGAQIYSEYLKEHGFLSFPNSEP